MIENVGNENWPSCEENQGKGGSERYAIFFIFLSATLVSRNTPVIYLPKKITLLRMFK